MSETKSWSPRVIKLLFSLVLLLATSLSVRAQDSVHMTLIDGGYGRSGKQILYGLKVDLDSGWHSYWLSPGETGLPSSIIVEPGSNVASQRILWPEPERFHLEGFEIVGYRKSFVIPFAVTVEDPTKIASFKLSGSLYACDDQCVPFPIKLSSDTAPGFIDAASQAEIAPWLASAPSVANAAIKVLGTDYRNGVLTVRFSSKNGIARPDVFVDLGREGFASQRSSTISSDGTATVELDVKALHSAPVTALGKEVVISDGNGNVLLVSDSQPASATFDFGIIATALIGGFILNVMPCVFPILAIKLFTLMSVPVGRRRASFLLTAGGIVVAFAALAVGVAILKLAGQTVGWGMQFQQPVFIGAIAIVVAAMGASLMGAFNISLPSTFATKLSLSTDGTGLLASFGQGFVLTLLATPCSAPFVGTAVGYALSRDPFAIITIFVAMGIGMAIPYIVLAAMPSLASLMPRPGIWMDRIKTLMALCMFATASWFLTLLAPRPSLACIYAVVMVIAFAEAATLMKRKVRTSSLVLALATMMSVPLYLTVLTPSTATGTGVKWEKFDDGRIKTLVSEGRTVFVDISADWCLTCKVNERGALATDDVAKALGGDVVAMKGDWTKPDEKISSFLAAHGRYGIPFYLVVGPRLPEGVVLPELLTSASVKNAISSASGH